MKSDYLHRKPISGAFIAALVTTLFSVIFLISCAEDIQTTQKKSATLPSVWEPPQSALSQRNFNLTAAHWRPSGNLLHISGASNNAGERILFKNAQNAKLLASTLADSSGNWSIEIKSLNIVPCFINVVSESGSLQSAVIDAPANCGAENTALATSIFPEGSITSPQTDLTIEINDSVNFQAEVSNSVGTPMFEWSFNGAAPGSKIQNPGNIKFTKPGIYHVALEVTDSRGLSDPTPAMRMIKVIDGTSALAAQPVANIDTPAEDQTIVVGSSINFGGSGSDPASTQPLVFMWFFGTNASPTSSNMQNPGDVVFNTAGVYTVVLAVSDNSGNTGVSQRTITVVDPGPGNQPPTGMITSPAVDLIINIGDTINIMGDAIDLDGNTPISYQWDFGGVIPNSNLQNPGPVTYLAEGVYTITLVATDSMGAIDPNPPTRVITVQAAGPGASDTPNGEILTPAMDTTITAGDSISFTATGAASTGNEPLFYIWSIEGFPGNFTGIETGPVTFDTPGVYAVTLLVVDASNQVDPTPAVRIITVSEPGVSGPAAPPAMNGHIVIPETDISILPGASQNFVGRVDEVNPPYTYLWLFDGAAHNQFTLETEAITFNDPGIYNVMFFAIDKDGMFDSRPAIRSVTVTDSTPTPILAPISSINVPESDVTINIGETILFSGTAVNVSGNGELSYLWTFGGAAADDTNLTPAPVTFSMAGVYTITFTATDAAASSEPASIVVTVEDPANSVPPATPGTPTAEIIITGGDTTITAGNAIDFAGNYVGNPDATLEYLWTFGGAALDSTELSPGPVVFNEPGQYEVLFTVIDSTDPANQLTTTASVTIMVMPVGQGGPGPVTNMPSGLIEEPAGNQTITVGGTLQFSGSGTNPIDNDPLNYAWDFGNGTTSTSQVPGVVTFNEIGVFTVTLTVNHAGMVFDPDPPTIEITVISTDPAP